MKPILFNTDMVRTIQEDRKTVTRRVVRPQPFAVKQDEKALCWCGHFVSESGKVLSDKPPYRPGDILYVRETFFEHKSHFYYKADGKHEGFAMLGITFKWRPSIHMPREAARIFLRVTNLRVERLQEITEEQAQAEGVKGWMIATDRDWDKNPNHRIAFRHEWNQTIKKEDFALYGWDADPWVWVIEFERHNMEKAIVSKLDTFSGGGTM